MIIVESHAEERKRLMLVAIAEARISPTSRDRLYALKLIAEDKQRRRNAWREIAELATRQYLRVLVDMGMIKP